MDAFRPYWDSSAQSRNINWKVGGKKHLIKAVSTLPTIRIEISSKLKHEGIPCE